MVKLLLSFLQRLIQRNGVLCIWKLSKILSDNLQHKSNVTKKALRKQSRQHILSAEGDAGAFAITVFTSPANFLTSSLLLRSMHFWQTKPFSSAKAKQKGDRRDQECSWKHKLCRQVITYQDHGVRNHYTSHWHTDSLPISHFLQYHEVFPKERQMLVKCKLHSLISGRVSDYLQCYCIVRNDSGRGIVLSETSAELECFQRFQYSW